MPDDLFTLTEHPTANYLIAGWRRQWSNGGRISSGLPRYLIEKNGAREIDIAVSPQLSTTSSILSHVRRGDVARVHRLRRGAAEAMEAIVHGDARSSRVVGRRIDQIALPAGVTIGAIVRGDDVIVAWEEVVVESGDHVILFVVDRGHVRAVERLFQVGLSFF